MKKARLDLDMARRERLMKWLRARRFVEATGKEMSLRDFEAKSQISKSTQTSWTSQSANPRGGIDYGAIAKMAEYDGVSSEEIQQYIRGRIPLEALKPSLATASKEPTNADIQSLSQKVDLILHSLGRLTLLENSVEMLKAKVSDVEATLSGITRRMGETPDMDSGTFTVDSKIYDLLYQASMSQLSSLLSQVIQRNTDLKDSSDKIESFLAYCPNATVDEREAIAKVINNTTTDLGEIKNNVLFLIQIALVRLKEGTYSIQVLEQMLSEPNGMKT